MLIDDDTDLDPRQTAIDTATERLCAELAATTDEDQDAIAHAVAVCINTHGYRHQDVDAEAVYSVLLEGIQSQHETAWAHLGMAALAAPEPVEEEQTVRIAAQTNAELVFGGAR